MSSPVILLIAILAAAAGGWFGFRLHIPMGGMLCAMAASAAVSLALGEFSLGSTGILVLQLFVGLCAGCGVDRSRLRAGKKALPILAVLFPLYCLFDIGFGLLMSKSCSMDLITAMFALVPGGVTDMGTIAVEMGADQTIVGILQLVRVLICSILYPQVFAAILRRQKRGKSVSRTQKPAEKIFRWFPYLLTAAAAAAGGIALKLLHVPGGAILGAMLASAAVSCAFDGAAPPKPSPKILQVFSGLYLGSLITAATISTLSTLLLPLLIQLVNMVLFEIVAVALVVRICKIDLATALPACATGGLTEMLPVTYELGGDALVVSTVHALRLAVVVATFPHIARAVALLI